MDIDTERGAFGLALRRLRRDANMSQEELAERAHISVESISALERGRRRAPYRETIRMISDALRLSEAQRQELEVAARRRVPSEKGATSPFDARSPAVEQPFAIDTSRQNLFRPLSTFHGRRRELRDLAQLLANHRLVSIIGAGGIGKTRVAVELSWTLLERFRDGVWFVDLAPVSDHAVVARSFITTLAIPNVDGQAELETLVHHLRRCNALLVVDNCEHVVDQVAVLVEALLNSCPNLHVLTTSREPLHIFGERVYRIPPLESPPDVGDLSAEKSLEFAAVALFVDRAIAANSAFTYSDGLASTIAQTCRRLDGIALAIELAASRVAVLSPSQILAQLDDHFRILTGGSRTALPRQRTMRETIRWSYDRLSDAEQALFRRVAIFANGFTWNAVCTLTQSAAPDEAAILDVLTSLVDRSLILSDSSATVTRYRLLEPVRAYGLEMLTQAAELEDMRRRFGAWCLEFARAAHEAWATASSSAWSALVEPEMDNLRACLIWALEDRNDIPLGQRIIATARRLWARRFPSEGNRWVRAARQLITEQTSADVIAGLALAEAQIHTVLFKYSTALAAAKICEAAYREPDDELNLAEALGFAGSALAHLGRDAEGEKLMAASVARYRERGAQQLIAYGVNYQGMARMVQGDVLTARQLLGEALVLFRDLGNESGAGSVAANLAEAEFRAGDAQTAVRLCQEAIETLSNGREARIALGNLAAYLVDLGRYNDAREKARESILRGGIARADVEIALALQHLAAVAALRPKSEDNAQDDISRAALLLGFVDSRLAAFDSIREYTEQQEYDTIVDLLRSRVGVDEFEALRTRGGSWSEDVAVREALQI
jgi:predicted ATPase/DNA-binding XRE family transcriptional regulator